MAEYTNVGELIGYVEYIDEAYNCKVGELIGYVEYIGDAAGTTPTADIPSVGELIGYVEYTTTSVPPTPPVTTTEFGPQVWMM